MMPTCPMGPHTAWQGWLIPCVQCGSAVCVGGLWWPILEALHHADAIDHASSEKACMKRECLEWMVGFRFVLPGWMTAAIAPGRDVLAYHLEAVAKLNSAFDVVLMEGLADSKDGLLWITEDGLALYHRKLVDLMHLPHLPRTRQVIMPPLCSERSHKLPLGKGEEVER